MTAAMPERMEIIFLKLGIEDRCHCAAQRMACHIHRHIGILVNRAQSLNDLIEAIKNSIKKAAMQARRLTEARLVSNFANIKVGLEVCERESSATEGNKHDMAKP